MLERNDIGVRILDELPHNLQLPILETLILQHLFNGYNLARLDDLGLKDHAEAAVPDDAFGRVRNVLLRQRALGGALCFVVGIAAAAHLRLLRFGARVHARSYRCHTCITALYNGKSVSDELRYLLRDGDFILYCIS